MGGRGRESHLEVTWSSGPFLQSALYHFATKAIILNKHKTIRVLFIPTSDAWSLEISCDSTFVLNGNNVAYLQKQHSLFIIYLFSCAVLFWIECLVILT